LTSSSSSKLIFKQKKPFILKRTKGYLPWYHLNSKLYQISYSLALNQITAEAGQSYLSYRLFGMAIQRRPIYVLACRASQLKALLSERNNRIFFLIYIIKHICLIIKQR